MKKTLIERLVRYAKINTRSESKSQSIPSTKNQYDLLNILYAECVDIGLDKVKMSEFGIVTATLPSNTDKDLRTIGFIAHVDTDCY